MTTLDGRTTATVPSAGRREPSTPESHTEPRAGGWRPSTVDLGLLALLVGLAALLRLVLIGDQPGGLFQDEAAEGYDAWRLLHTSGFHPIFFDDDGGREALFAYLVAGAFWVAGDSVAVLRATAAAIGVLGVAATPLLLWRLGREAVLAGTAWAAGSLWLIAVERDGMRNTLVPLVGTVALAALVRWAARPSRWRAGVAGAACGAGLWTYQPLKLLPILALAWLLWLRWRDPRLWRRLRRGLLSAATAYAAVALPLVVVAVTDPAGYFGRALTVTAGSPGHSAGDLALHVLRTLGMLGVTGDPNPRHDAGGIPLIPLIPAALVVAGAVRAWRLRDLPLCSLLLIGLPVFMLPPLVGLEGDAPHALRALGLAPVVAGLVGLGAVEVVAPATREWRRWGRPVAVSLVAAGLALTAAESALAYFGRSVSARYDAYSYSLVALAQAAPQSSVVVVDQYSALVVHFVDRGREPRLATPGRSLGLAPGTLLVARSRADIAAAAGAATASAATVTARDPTGAPVVWRAVVP